MGVRTETGILNCHASDSGYFQILCVSSVLLVIWKWLVEISTAEGWGPLQLVVDSLTLGVNDRVFSAASHQWWFHINAFGLY